MDNTGVFLATNDLRGQLIGSASSSKTMTHHEEADRRALGICTDAGAYNNNIDYMTIDSDVWVWPLSDSSNPFLRPEKLLSDRNRPRSL